LRTFHTGELPGADITQGLPRIQEIFEARHPKRQSVINRSDRGSPSQLMKTLLTVTKEVTIKVKQILGGYQVSHFMSLAMKVAEGE